jgi:hypothetical protein
MHRLTTFQSKNLKGSDHLGDLGMDGSTILKCTDLLKIYVRMQTGFIYLKTRFSGSYEQSNVHFRFP